MSAIRRLIHFVIRSEIIRRRWPTWRSARCSAIVAMTHFVEFLHFFFTERLRIAEQMGNQRNLREVLHGFHFHVGTFE